MVIKGYIGVAQHTSQWDLSRKKCGFNGFDHNLRGPAERGYKVRTGGTGMQLMFAMMHTGAHLSAAVFLVLLLEMGVVTCIRYDAVSSEGYHSLYRWLQSFLEDHFPDPMGVRIRLEQVTLGIYPRIVKYTMAIFDIPEAVAVARNRMCEQKLWTSMTRLETAGYYFGMLAYYWVLAAPVMGIVFGMYLYISSHFFHVHYDEAFAALRIQNHKGFSRLHITKKGDLEIHTLAVDEVPSSWREDPSWRAGLSCGQLCADTHHSAHPSRWVPQWEDHGDGSRNLMVDDDGVKFKVVDYVFIPRCRQRTTVNETNETMHSKPKFN